MRFGVLMNMCGSYYTGFQASMHIGIVCIVVVNTLYKNLIINIDYYKQVSWYWLTVCFIMKDENNLDINCKYRLFKESGRPGNQATNLQIIAVPPFL